MSILDRLDEIQARADAATDGPWTWASHRTVDGDEWAVFDPHDWALASNRDGWTPDAEFIAAARTDVPWLIEQVRKLDAALRAVLDVCDELEANIPYDNGNATANHAGRTIRRAIAAALGEGS